MESLGISYINGKFQIPKQVFEHYVVKAPTVKNRLRRGGSLGLKMSEKYDLRFKKGVVWIDHSIKSYVILPSHLILQIDPSMKNCSGVDNTISVWSVKEIIETHQLELIKIPEEVQ